MTAIKSKHQLVIELTGVDCRCGAKKKHNAPFCDACLKRLMPYMRPRIWTKFGEGYEEAYENAARYLDGKP